MPELARPVFGAPLGIMPTCPEVVGVADGIIIVPVIGVRDAEAVGIIVGFMVGLMVFLMTTVIRTVRVVAPHLAWTVTIPGFTWAAILAHPDQFIGLVDVIIAEPPEPVSLVYGSFIFAEKALDPTQLNELPLFGQVPETFTICPGVTVIGDTISCPVPVPANAGAAAANTVAPAAATTAS